MKKNKVKLTICGSDYNVLSDDNEQYIIEIGNMVDKRTTEVLNANPRLSTTMAAILVALEYCDKASKSERKFEALKNKENKEFEENLVAKNNFNSAQVQIRNLQEEIDNLKSKISLISAENDQLIQQLSEQELDFQMREKDQECVEDVKSVGDILNFFDFQKIPETM